MFSRAHLVDDLLASIVVFLVALPLCMGIAIASGLPPATGLITGMIGGLVVGFLQGAPLQVSGPAAGLSVIVFELVQTHGIAALGATIMLAGLIQLGAGLLRGGRWFRAVPPSVIHGMLAGIGVLIFASQFHVMVDDKPKGSGLENLLTLPQAVWKGVVPLDGSPHEEAAAIGLCTIVVLVLWQKFAPKRLRAVPGALVAVAVATAAAAVLKLPIAYVSVPESLASVATLPTLDGLKQALSFSTLGVALALAVIASAETLLCAAAVDKMHSGPRTHYDREMCAQGVGNFLCGLLGAPPMTGVIVRSSANVLAGGKTRRSAILHGVWLLLFVAVLPFVLRKIPVSSLAAILVYTGYKLVNPAVIRQLRRYGRSEVAIYFATIVGIVATDLLKGVLIGLALATAKLLLAFSRLDIRVEDDPNSKRSVLHLRGAATFLRLPDLADALEAVPADRELHVRFDKLDYLDHASLELLMSWEAQHKARGGTVVIEWDELDQRYHRRHASGGDRGGAVPAGHELVT